jgi:membrane fusion protein, multidrug efflux system
MKKRSVIIVIAGVLVLAIAALVVVRIAGRRPALTSRRQNVPIVRAEQPRRETVTYTLESTGDVVSQQQASVVGKVNGTLEQVNVNLGDQVRREQLLAVIDAPELGQQVQQAAATLFTARADYDRSRQLLNQNLTTAQEFENAEALMKIAEVSYQSAQTRLGYAQVTAPFSGTITRRFVDAGAIVTANSTTLFTLMDLDNLKVVVNVLEKDVPLIETGAEAVIIADALPRDSLYGRVGRLSQAVDPATRTMPVEVFVSSRDHRLKPGMYATVSLVLAEHPNAITIPVQAVLKDAGGSFVYTIANDSARRVPVQAGIEQGDRTEVISGLVGTENVIATGQQYVKDGGAVMKEESKSLKVEESKSR